MEDTDRSVTFIEQLYQILNTKSYEKFIGWSVSGETILIRDVKAFSEKLLPLHFQYRSFQSFARQLKLHSFQKVNSRIFSHPFFHRDQPSRRFLINKNASASKDRLDRVMVLSRQVGMTIERKGQLTRDITLMQQKYDALKRYSEFLRTKL